MNKPSCYASQPNVIAQAENDCGKCSVNGDCITEVTHVCPADSCCVRCTFPEEFKNANEAFAEYEKFKADKYDRVTVL